MDAFVVSARKYRPATFDTVVGQEAVTGTLMNAIRTGHLAQAFLFCGPRGVGKTTCARILARTINCEQLNPDLTTCGECAPCKTFAEGHSLNIYELDAASNNSVDDIRNLILQVQIAPQVGTRKVYIIDEVHMLSAAAFNAFLKTLEEPPSYAIFILATTEKHKILPTILSRCQVFDFRRITVNDIVKQLATIAEREGIEAEPQALHVIARKADGGMRDALSMFDQLVSFSGRRLTYQNVVDQLNVLDHDHYFSITDSVLRGDIPAALVELDTILRNGFDGHLFLAGLGRHMRDLLVCQDPRSVSLLEVSEDLAARYAEQAGRTPRELIVGALDRIGQADTQFKASKEPRLLVELLLIQLCRLAQPQEAEKKKPEHIAGPVTPAASGGEAGAVVPVNAPAPASTMQLPVVTAPAKPARRMAMGMSLQELSGSSKDKAASRTAPELDLPGPDLSAPPKVINEALLRTVWREYALARKREGRNSLHATLSAREPRVVGPNAVAFAILNDVQEKYFREEGHLLMTYLRQSLDAPGLDLTIEREEVKDLKPRYTPRDRFTIMAERNPALNKLREELDLDLG